MSPDDQSIDNVLQRIGCVSEFDAVPVDDSAVKSVVEAASWAPSFANLQPWEIISIRSAEQRNKISAVLLDSLLRPEVGGGMRRSWVADAPLLLVVCLDEMRAKVRVGDIGKDLFGIQDTGMAIQTMRLKAQSLGIQSCLVREFDIVKMADILGLPKHVRPLIMIAMGYSSVEAKTLPRLPLEDYLHHESW